VSVQVAFLENFSAGFIAPDFESCNAAPLAPGRTCVLLVTDLPDDVTFECSATAVTGNVKNLRGTAELRAFSREGEPFTIAAQDMR
jgi:hypothetical protein